MQNMNVELVAQMFKNYQSNVLFHLEGMRVDQAMFRANTDAPTSDGQSEGSCVMDSIE